MSIIETGAKTGENYRVTQDFIIQRLGIIENVPYIDLNSDRFILSQDQKSTQNSFLRAYVPQLRIAAGKISQFVTDYVHGFRIADDIFREFCERNGTPVPTISIEDFRKILLMTSRGNNQEQHLLKITDHQHLSGPTSALERIITTVQPEFGKLIRSHTGPGRKLLSAMGVFDGVLPFYSALHRQP